MSQQSQTTRKILNSAWVCAGLEKVSNSLKKQKSYHRRRNTQTSSKGYFWFYHHLHTHAVNDCVQFKCYCTDVLYHAWKARKHAVWVRTRALSIPHRRAASSSPAALCAYGRSADPETVSWAGEGRRPERQPELSGNSLYVVFTVRLFWGADDKFAFLSWQEDWN